ncbi:MAG: endonuclease/exonuclease/phosphatase family protein [Saprospiraceae bacterium]|nr:endonuclease/exonuclease/phosphatase family protein [Saprospiraceae bacterium]MBP7699291.1 endonuclease/exonuclease/phosphatase family protein [Saprospiraceae bacterium]
MSKYIITIITLTTFLVISCTSSRKLGTSQIPQNLRIMFYNVENLMDTLDNPLTDDDEFTPNGKNKWVTERYYKKLDNLSDVVAALEYPALIGLSEIENRAVLDDFIKTQKMSPQKYEIVQYESPDHRGIDVALLYRSEVFKILKSEPINVAIPSDARPADEDGKTRDILHVQGIVGKNDTLHIFVNHWPSRRDGKEKSEPKRIFAAQQLRKQVDNLLAKNSNVNIIITGDFNDEPTDNSITTTLMAKNWTEPFSTNALINLAYPLNDQGKGSYNYRGSWDCIDQMITSAALKNHKNNINVTAFNIFDAEWLLFDDKKFGKTPNRTYGGPNYYGGYSDHLPIYGDFLVK